MRLIALFLLLTPLFAEGPLAVRNVRYDAKKMTVEFDLVNTSAKPVRAWLIDVVMGGGLSQVTPQHCAPLAAESWHCTANVDLLDRAVEPEVRVNAVLFADGTAAGDLKVLQAEIDDAALRLRALEAWQKDLHATPPDIGYTSAVMNERAIVDAFAAKETPAQVAAMLQARLNMARERSRLFPVSPTRLAPLDTVPSTVSIASHAPRFAVVAKEVNSRGKLRLVFRNDYDKEIVAFAFTERQPDGRLMSSSEGEHIKPGGLQEWDYGVVGEGNSLDLACVVFRDGTSDGDPAVAQKMRDQWAGRKAETDRILPLLQAIVNLPTAERPGATKALIAELKEQLQRKPDAGHDIDYVFGENAVCKTVARELAIYLPDVVLTNLQEQP
jgi:hypothetical protein